MSGKVAVISTFPPTKCGVANYTYNLIQSMEQNGYHNQFQMVVILDPSEQTDKSHCNGDFWYLRKDQIGDFKACADKINQADDIQAVLLQHEFGLYYGFYGSYILELIKRLEKPLITTFHTVQENSNELHKLVQCEIADKSHYVVSINNRARHVIHQVTGIPEDRIVHIPFGVFEPVSAVERGALRQDLGWSERKVCMTFGMLQPHKGIELILEALSEVRRTLPDVLYVIMGETHPNVKRIHGEAYREKLERLVEYYGLEHNVQFLNVYLNEMELNRYITACDLFLTPYPMTEQVSSGALSQAIGMGRAVLSTPFSHAKDLLQGHDDLLIPYGDVERWARQIVHMLSDNHARRQCEQQMTEIARTMRWSRVSELYHSIFHLAQGDADNSQMATVRNAAIGEQELLNFWESNLKLPYDLSEGELRRFWDIAGVPYNTKVSTVLRYRKRFGIRQFIETGTYRGEMIESVNDHFERIISIELSEMLAKEAAKRFAGSPHITIRQGDSATELGTILQPLTEPCLFWLDAHYSEADTARGKMDTPIMQELHHIFNHAVQNHVILIDDARCFIGPNPIFRNYPTIQQLEGYVAKKRPDWIFEVKEDIIRIHPPS